MFTFDNGKEGRVFFPQKEPPKDVEKPTAAGLFDEYLFRALHDEHENSRDETLGRGGL